MNITQLTFGCIRIGSIMACLLRVRDLNFYPSKLHGNYLSVDHTLRLELIMMMCKNQHGCLTPHLSMKDLKK